MSPKMNITDQATRTINEVRLRLGLKQSDLARLLDVSTRTIVRWEAGVTVPHAIYLKRMTDMLKETR